MLSQTSMFDFSSSIICCTMHCWSCSNTALYYPGSHSVKKKVHVYRCMFPHHQCSLPLIVWSQSTSRERSVTFEPVIKVVIALISYLTHLGRTPGMIWLCSAESQSHISISWCITDQEKAGVGSTGQRIFILKHITVQQHFVHLRDGLISVCLYSLQLLVL
jgi:hypothetical protein